MDCLRNDLSQQLRLRLARCVWVCLGRCCSGMGFGFDSLLEWWWRRRSQRKGSRWCSSGSWGRCWLLCWLSPPSSPWPSHPSAPWVGSGSEFKNSRSIKLLTFVSSYICRQTARCSTCVGDQELPQSINFKQPIFAFELTVPRKKACKITHRMGGIFR